MPNKIYPWEKWLAGRRRWISLQQGRDYDCSTSTMVQQLRNAACRLEIGMSIEQRDDVLEVRTYPTERKEKRRRA